jgi:hypothetical protein
MPPFPVHKSHLANDRHAIASNLPTFWRDRDVDRQSGRGKIWFWLCFVLRMTRICARNVGNQISLTAHTITVVFAAGRPCRLEATKKIVGMAPRLYWPNNLAISALVPLTQLQIQFAHFAPRSTANSDIKKPTPDAQQIASKSSTLRLLISFPPLILQMPLTALLQLNQLLIRLLLNLFQRVAAKIR